MESRLGGGGEESPPQPPSQLQPPPQQHQPQHAVTLSRTRRSTGYVFEQEEGEEEEEEEEAEQEVIGGEYGDEEGGGAGYDDDVLEGFEDWHMDGELHDGDLEGDGAAGYDDGTWPAEQEGLPDLPELIFTEGCDDDGVDLGPCISLRRCSNGRLPVSGAGPSGDVDAVRVMLLGVSGE